MPAPSRQTLRVGAGHFWPQRPAAQTLSVPPAASFLSAAKEKRERTPPKTNGFWNSFRPITATPQKGPRRIAPAPIPAAASTCRGEMPYPTAVEQCTSAWYVGAAAIRGLHAIRCTTMFGNLSRAWYAAAVFSAPQPRRKSLNLRFQAAFLVTFGAAAKSDPRSEVRCPPFEKKNERAVEDDADPCKKHIALQKRDPAPLGAGSL